MRKSGLHKQISSIFDGVPLQAGRPEESTAADTADASSASAQNETCQKTETAQRLSADPAGTPQTPAVTVMRPTPMPKKKITRAKSNFDVSKHIQKIIFGSNGNITPQQKKMTALMGVLALVFVGVLYMTLGGVGGSSSGSAEKDTETTTPSLQSATQHSLKNWTAPKPVPASLRDATSIVISDQGKSQSDQQPGSGDLVVRGIVYSQTRPSAIINEHVYSQGEVINGVTVKAITREGVTFEANGKSWTQEVRR